MVDDVAELSNCACISINCSKRLSYVSVVFVAELEPSADDVLLDAGAVVIVTVEPSG